MKNPSSLRDRKQKKKARIGLTFQLAPYSRNTKLDRSGDEFGEVRLEETGDFDDSARESGSKTEEAQTFTKTNTKSVTMYKGCQGTF